MATSELPFINTLSISGIKVNEAAETQNVTTSQTPNPLWAISVRVRFPKFERWDNSLK